MLESNNESAEVQRKNTNNSEDDQHDTNLLDNNPIQSEIYERKRNWYLPSDPLGFKHLEKIWYIFKYGKTPLYVHITLPIYIIATLIFSLFHGQPLTWFTHILLLLICHMTFIAMQIFFSLYVANKFDAHIHRIVIWPYGYIGYATDYKQWTHFMMVEYAGPLVHLVLFIIFWGIAAILQVANWSYTHPMNVYFGRNLLNGLWVTNIIIASLHICIPVYSMKTGRAWVNYLYRKRTHKEVAHLILLPTGFMVIILLIIGIVDAKPLILFLGLWSMYQTYLLWDGNRKNLIAKLPLFQSLDDRLRQKRGRKKKSMDVGQKNRNDILNEFDQTTQSNTDQNMSRVEEVLNRKKMGTLDEEQECEPNMKNEEPIEIVQEPETEKDRVIEDKSVNEETEQKEVDLLNMGSNDSAPKEIEIVSEEKKEDETSENVEDLLTVESDKNVAKDDNIGPMNELVPQHTGDSGVVVAGKSIDGSDYELVDVGSNQRDSKDSTPKSDEFVEVDQD